MSLPFGLSPTASQKLAHPDGEAATSRAAAKYGLCMGLSSYSNYPLEEVGAQGLGNPYAIQMCVLRDRSITLQLLKRAEGLFLWMTGPAKNQHLDIELSFFRLMFRSWACA